MAAIVDRLVLQAAEKLPGTDNEDGVCIACAETARVSDWDVTVSRVEDGLTGWRPLWLVRKKMSHSLIEEFSDTASKEDSTHECGALGH